MTMYHVEKSLIFLILLFLIQFSSPTDTLTTGQTLKDGELLVSANETFTLGFFSPGMSKNRYLGIWYSKISEKTVVWVANRDNPINNSFGVLSLEDSGNLAIHGLDLDIPVWSTKFSGLVKNHVARLLDTGNLVVFEENTKGVIAWQSFDHPTDTLLPTMKLGASLKPGVNWSLTSWKSLDDPGTGEYSYRMNLGEYPELFIYKGLDRVWRAGPWNGVRLSGVPEINFIFNAATYVENQDEVSVINGMHDPSIYSKGVLNQWGVVERMTWNPERRRWGVFWSTPKDPCEYYGQCGPNGICNFPYAGKFECSCLPGFEPNSLLDWNFRDGSGGCLRKRDSNVCRNGEGFIKVSRTKVPETTMTLVNRSIGLKECEKECLSNCNCTAYTSANVSGVGTGCVMWYGDLMDIREFESTGEDLFIRADSLEVAEYLKRQHSSSSKERTVEAVGASVGAVVILTVIILCWLAKKRKGADTKPIHVKAHDRAKYTRWARLSLDSARTEKRRHGKLLFSPNISTQSQSSLIQKQLDESEPTADIPSFNLRTLIEATDGFSIKNKLGQGGFGSVYKGTLKSGHEIAVKRLSRTSGQGVEEFTNEAILIAKLQHRNLVRLLGYCVQQDEKMLIYEYMSNKSLDSIIFDKTKGSFLDWGQRLIIIMGITRGLVYLHHDSRLRIIHRDLKSSNVLLDSAMNPKISDFGMARILGGNQIEANTHRVAGTYGYMAPEYATRGLFSTKSDVFSFGVLLLEIISGRRNNSYCQENPMHLIGHVWDLWRDGRALEIADMSLGDSYSAKEVLRCIHVGLLSVQEQAVDRPTMSGVAFMLSNETALPLPKQPAFTFKEISDQSLRAQSTNDVTVSVIDAR